MYLSLEAESLKMEKILGPNSYFLLLFDYSFNYSVSSIEALKMVEICDNLKIACPKSIDFCPIINFSI
ncbi:hypothetical protein EG346_18550 [Chryseobacterium carnipullorum]|uniref:Uncharacterized protein n=1 Tax=Chryseobacterium carnipullorum TaxID=1124835 RepID=A0A3G6NAP6_CHRCU|nr:hypothetical protein EG346_18550 [Chryseobacterium carnipullorum]AZA64934.1 hypothetical protein EG345_09585 [Chryseobacterium carnipullorum]